VAGVIGPTLHDVASAGATAPYPASEIPMPLVSILAALALAACAVATAADPTAAPGGPLDFTLTDAKGRPYPLAQHQGKVVLLVNVASQCGLTSQYKGLQALHTRYQAQGLVVIGIPANDFGGQEPGSDAEIQEFCSSTYSVTFPVLAKVSVKGDAATPLYAWLTGSSAKPGPIEWNFAKFLVGRDGALAQRFSPRTAPDAPELVQAIEQALAAKP
jgi:glutathione peroxidase